MSRHLTEIPEQLLKVIHYYMVAAQTLATAASEQAPELKGKPPAEILDAVMGGVDELWEATPRDRQLELLMHTANRLGELSGAISVERTDIIQGS